jgi:hypothetical protein
MVVDLDELSLKDEGGASCRTQTNTVIVRHGSQSYSGVGPGERKHFAEIPSALQCVMLAHMNTAALRLPQHNLEYTCNRCDTSSLPGIVGGAPLLP